MKRIIICLIALLGVVQATWADTTFGINISGVNGGTVTADKTNASYGETVTLTLKPEIMNELTVVSVIGATSGKSMPLTKNDNGTYSFLMPAEPVNVSAIFEMPHEYVTDVMVIGSKDQSVTNSLRYTYEPQGWYFIDKDLNEGAHGAYIYLLYKTERSTVNKGYVTDFYIKTGQGRPKSITHNGRTYYPVPGGGGDAFVADNVNCDLNYDANGEYIYLYYTTDPFEDNRAVFKIEFNSTKDGGVGANGGTSGFDLNNGAHGAYIYMHVMTGNPFVPGEQALWCSGNNTLYFVNNILGQSYAPGSTYKGQTVTNVWSGTKVTDTGWKANPGWNAIKDACTKVVFEPSFADLRPKSLYGWFTGFTKLKEIEGIENLNTSEVEDIDFMFENCESLETIDVSGFDVSKINSFRQMFSHCSKLTTIYCNDTWNVGQYEYTFDESTKLVGAIKYQSNVYRANPINGYFTSRTTLADNEDNTSMLTARNQYYGDVTIEGRTLNKNGSWNTLCLPFGMNNFTGTPLEGATVKTLSSTSYYGKTGTLTLDFEKVTSIEAGKPYIVKWENGGDNITNPVFKGVTINNQINNVETDAVTFCGVFNPFILKAYDRKKLYLGSSNTLYYPSKERTVNSFRAYFQLADGITAGNPTNGTQGVKAFVLNLDDEETGLSPIPSPNGEGGAYYSLDGRRLSGKPTQKGVYIINGRKVVIK